MVVVVVVVVVVGWRVSGWLSLWASEWVSGCGTLELAQLLARCSGYRQNSSPLARTCTVTAGYWRSTGWCSRCVCTGSCSRRGAGPHLRLWGDALPWGDVCLGGCLVPSDKHFPWRRHQSQKKGRRLSKTTEEITRPSLPSFPSWRCTSPLPQSSSSCSRRRA